MLHQPLQKSYSNSGLEIATEKPISLRQLLQQTVKDVIKFEELATNYQQQLQIKVFCFKINFEHREWTIRKRLIDFTHLETDLHRRYHKEIPALPIVREAEISIYGLQKVADFLTLFLKSAVFAAFIQPAVQDFLEIMPHQVGKNLILAAVPLKKLSGGRYREATFSRKFTRLFCGCCRNWRERHFVVTQEGIFYTKNRKVFQLKEMLTYNPGFCVLHGRIITGHTLGIVIKSSYREMTLRASSIYDYTLFLHATFEALAKSPYIISHRYDSFSPIRDKCQSRFLIDGENYFQRICQQLHKAKREVFITDWMMTPYMQLSRPSTLDDRSSRLDYIFEALAARGVAIYIILYMEPKIALNNDSEFVEKYLQQFSRNIKVLRHPNYVLIPFLWSHHEKIVIIDREVGFLGGLDLCYGRWDNSKHNLSNEKSLWQGADYCNFRISDIYEPRNFLTSNLRSPQPRMPWHDVGVELRGPCVHDLSRHFIQYWNFVSFQTRFNDRQLLLHSGRTSLRQTKQVIPHEIQSFLTENSTAREASMLKQGFNLETSSPSKDKRDLNNSNNNMTEAEFYERCLLQKEKVSRSMLESVPDLSKIKDYPLRILRSINESGVEVRLNVDHLEVSESEDYRVERHQIIRSSSSWSIGLKDSEKECSIYHAYLELIEHSEHFIYIQNQFFISYENLVPQAIARRLLKAYREKAKFKVLILMPLLPGFEGQITNEGSAVMRVQLHLEYQTIKRGKESLYNLIAQIPNPDDYIQFYSLRQHAVIDGVPTTEILYIHTKLLIVDDCRAIIGSANINDRSLLGDRDSEIGVVIEQIEKYEVAPGYWAGQQIHKLRTDLYKEHFGASYGEAIDPNDEDTWSSIQIRAKNNTLIFRRLFGCYPDDSVETLDEIAKLKEKAEPHLYKQLYRQIDGHVVQLPVNFLRKEDMSLKPSQKEYYIPLINFT